LVLAGPAHGADRIGAHAVASAHPLATEAGLEILRAGGNAFDAAVAVSAALAVVEPVGCGLGGGGFWLLHRASDGLDTFVDGRETAPAAATRDMYLDRDGNVVPNLSLDGPLSSAIPGTPAALAHIAARYGTLPLARLLAPAIRLARDGFATDEIYARAAERRAEALRRWPAAQIFLDAGRPPRAGFVLKQPDLAITLEALAQDGAPGFYTGAIASELVKGVHGAGGIWTLEDLAGYQVKERAPVRGRYNGTRIVSAPPPSSGGIALIETLNILKGFPLKSLDATTQKHLIVEALRRAYRDRAEYLGDGDFVSVPVKRLLNVFYAEGLRASIRLDRATPSSALPAAVSDAQGPQTTHFSVLDADGNRVAATLTLNYAFGAAFVPPGTGVLLNDEMDDFSAKPGTPNAYGLVGATANAIAANKRPLSSMTPTFVERNDGFAILGTPGGSRIISMVLLGVLEYTKGGDAAAIVRRPRFHHQYLPDKIVYEEGAFSMDDLSGLERRGHTLEQSTDAYGDMHAIVWKSKTRSVSAASDPRGHGRAAVLQAATPK
jgi:gamma-glutamyltranspeptidase/glutathione hydrolase